MNDYKSNGQEPGASGYERRGIEAVAKRVHRALDGFFHVEAADDDGEYTVFSGSGNTYTVNLPEGTCTCADSDRGGAWCKHAHRAAFVTGEIPDIDGVRTSDDTDTSEETTDSDDTDTEDDGETLEERIERFGQENPGASAIEAISQLGIDPDNMERVEEVLA
jgi:hypothetical protein